MHTSTESNTVAGTYSIKVHTPIGDQEGQLSLDVDGDLLSGRITNEKGMTEFTGGTVHGSEVKFNTKIRTRMGRLKARVKGKVENGTFTGVAQIPLGKAKIEGKRTQIQETGD